VNILSSLLHLKVFNFLLIRKISLLKICFIIFVAEKILFGTVTNANTISCSSIETRSWDFVGDVNVCVIDKSISILTPGYKIYSEKDDTITGFEAEWIKNMFYLPDSPSETFPNLQAYSAYRSSVREISAANFKNLNKLRLLWLSKNQIEKVNINTFKDLESLEWLYLGLKNHR
jgi:Leucine-rich repeat (LRR) protein